MRRGIAIACATAAAFLAACGGAGNAVPPSAAPQSAGGPAAVDPAAAMVVGRQHGLELHWWITRDDRNALAEALGGQEIALPPDTPAGAALDEWRLNGFRIARVPLEQYEELAQALPSRIAFERLWFGQTLEWRPLFTGRTIDRARLLVSGEPTQPPRGRLRLLGRSWVAPGAVGQPVLLRLELLPQVFQRAPQRRFARPEQEPPTLDALREGEVLDWAPLQLALEEGWIYVLTAAGAGEEWDTAPDQAAEEDAQQVPFGPVGPQLITPGEAMLLADPDDESLVRPRILLVLIPRLPDRYSLFAN